MVNPGTPATKPRSAGLFSGSGTAVLLRETTQESGGNSLKGRNSKGFRLFAPP